MFSVVKNCRQLTIHTQNFQACVTLNEPGKHIVFDAPDNVIVIVVFVCIYEVVY